MKTRKEIWEESTKRESMPNEWGIKDKGTPLVYFQHKSPDEKFYSEDEIKNTMIKVGQKIGLNTTGAETDEGYDESTSACWECALLRELEKGG